MSEMDTSESSNECASDSILLDRVFLRLGNADTDEKLESCLSRFLTPVILKLSSSHEQIRTKVMEILVHVNKRVKCRNEVQLPVETLLELYKDPEANSFIVNFSIIYITMGFPRLPEEKKLALTPLLLEAVENKPEPHQDSIMMLVVPLLGEISKSDLKVFQRPKVASKILKLATDILLLPYRALPSSGVSEFQVPPGMSLKSYRKIVEKHQINANQLEEMKISAVKFISQDIFKPEANLLPLIVAAADSRFSVANCANSPLSLVSSNVDWSQIAVTGPLFTMYLGTTGNVSIPPDERKVPACTRLRLKIIQYLMKASGEALGIPQCVQVVYSSLFEPNTNSRLRNMALMFLLNIINNGGDNYLSKVSQVYLQGILKVIKSDEFAEHHAKAYICLGRLAAKYPHHYHNQFNFLEELIKKIPEAAPEMKTVIRDALLEMAVAYKIKTEDTSEPMDTSESPSTSQSDTMEVDENSRSKKLKPSPLEEPQGLALYAILEHYLYSEEPMIRYIAMRYVASVFPQHYIPSRYLLLLACGDSNDDVSTEALKYLYGTSRPNEIEDVVNNFSIKKTVGASIDEDAAKKENIKQEEEFTVPKFKDVVNYVWDQMQKRKKGSNAKHRFVVNNQVLQFHPQTYQEILRYLRMCLNRDADLKDCSNHPNATSPMLAKYIQENLLETEVLERYLNMITTLLNVSPGVSALTCFLDIVGCVPKKMSEKYTHILPFLKTLFTTSTKEDIREISAAVYAIISVQTNEKSVVENEIEKFVAQSQKNMTLESQCGYLIAFTHLCERSIVLSKKGNFGGKGFNPSDWEPYKLGALCLANFLTSSQTLLASTSCTAISILVRCTALPLPNISTKQESLLESDDPFKVDKNDAVELDDEVTKFTVVERLFKIVGNAKLPSKIKERSLLTLGLLCCGERFPFAKLIVKGFLQMAKDTKEFEIHLQIGEALVLCVEGVNSNENRDLWTELPKEGEAKIKDTEALKENDELLRWLLAELFKIGRQPHPHSRQATSVWLLALLKNCPEREPIKATLPNFQYMFMDYLSENSDIVQDVASKGLSLVYQNSDENQKRALVGEIIEQLTSGKRTVSQVTEDTMIFEEGQLGKAPTGGNLSTYKELCSLASDLNQPDLLYKFMHLAHHNSVWNSKRGAAFGFQSIAQQAGAALAGHAPRIVPRLYRYRFDPTPRIQAAMASIWHALVPDTPRTVQKYHAEILRDLVANLTSNQWRVRMSCCNALSDLLRSVQSVQASLAHMAELWAQLFRVMDDVHEGTRLAAAGAANVLAKLCVQASDAELGNDGKAVVAAVLPPLLQLGITNGVQEVRNVSLQTVSRLAGVAGGALAPWLPRLVPALAEAAGELEAPGVRLAGAAADERLRELLDDVRASAAKSHYTVDTLVKCMPHLNVEILKATLPQIFELMRSPHLGTKVACTHFLALSAHYLRADIEPVVGKIMNNLLNGVFDRNLTIRKNCADAIGQISVYAKPQYMEKFIQKLLQLNESRDDDVARSAVALTLKSVAKAKIEHLKDNEDVLAPVIFLEMHEPTGDASAPAEAFAELWAELGPARRHAAALCAALERALAAASWPRRVQAAMAISTLCKEAAGGLGEERERLVRAVLAALRGRAFDGKHRLLDGLADLCEAGSAPGEALAAECARALAAEGARRGARLRRHALRALARVLPLAPRAAFHEAYDVVRVILCKNETTKEDSDDDGPEGIKERIEESNALKEAAYDLLGKAWPKDAETQEKYQELFFEHCAARFPGSARATQLAMLASLRAVLRRTRALRGAAARLAPVVAFTLENNNQVRHRRDALDLMEILLMKLKETNKTQEINMLKDIYDTYAHDLSKESSHELRSKVESIKVYFTQ